MNWKAISKILFFSLIPTLIFSQFSENRTHLILNDIDAETIENADLDNDGTIDVIFYSKNDIFWCKNNGNRNFSSPIILTNIVKDFCCKIHSVELVDVDQDEDIDILFLSISDQIVWLENDGHGSFSQPIIIQDFAKEFYLIDFDTDGDLDILSMITDDKLRWLVNNGTGNFSSLTNLISLSEISDILSADVNLDGTNDLVVAHSFFMSTKGVSWYSIDKDGNISQPNLITDRITSSPYKLIDVDNDNKIDLATLGGWFKNIGEGNFSSVKPLPYALCESDIDWVDIDNDNDLDAIVIGKCTVTQIDTVIRGGNLGWYANDGQGNFSSLKIISELRGTSITTLDVDSDGDIDIVANNNNLLWYENLLNLPSITIISFEDINENGIYDDFEIPISNIKLQINPEAISSFSNSIGVSRFFVEEGIYDLSVTMDSCWELSSEYTLSNIEFNGITDTIYLGFRLLSEIQNSSVRVTSTATRCGFQVPFNLSVENDGCPPIKGLYGLVIDSLIELVEVEVEPEEIRGDTLLWSQQELIASEIEQINLQFQMPSADFIGEIIYLKALSYIENEQGDLELSSTYDYKSEIRCAYDPNDKLVTPNRLVEYNQNYTLFDESLEYTIRFQNTGNDTAFNVVIRDTLDKNLVWETFKPILASHSFETLLYKDGQVEFSFRNILLPDSTINEPLSHGFVTYKILPKKDLPENTVIENTAGIYFDFNPPIITNTTMNVLVSELPKTTSIHTFQIEQQVKVYPNPFDNFVTVEQKVFETSNLPTLSLFDVAGQQVQSVILKDATQQISTAHLGNGLYFYRVINPDGQRIANGKVIKH